MGRRPGLLSWRGDARKVALALTVLAAGCGGADSPTTPPTTVPRPAPSPTPRVSNEGLVLLLHMDEPAWTGASGEVRDSSGGGRHGTATPGATTVARARFDRGGVFVNESCVRIEDDPALRPAAQLTLSAWAQPVGLGLFDAMGVISKRVDYLSGSAYALFFDSADRLSADVDTENDRFAAPTAFANGLWYHLGLVYDGAQPAPTRVRLFVNGQTVAIGAESAPSITPFSSPLWVGCLPLTSPAQGFIGILDEVAVWHRALTAAEIGLLATATGPIQD